MTNASGIVCPVADLVAITAANSWGTLRVSSGAAPKVPHGIAHTACARPSAQAHGVSFYRILIASISRMPYGLSFLMVREFRGLPDGHIQFRLHKRRSNRRPSDSVQSAKVVRQAVGLAPCEGVNAKPRNTS
jgi:hypothetical protein